MNQFDEDMQQGAGSMPEQEDQQATRVVQPVTPAAPVRHRRAARYAASVEEADVEEQAEPQPQVANVRRVAPAAQTENFAQPRARMNQRGTSMQRTGTQPSQGVPRPTALLRSPNQGQSVQTAGPVTRPQQGNRRAVDAPGYTQQQPVQQSPYARPVQEDMLRARPMQKRIYDAEDDEWAPVEDEQEERERPGKRRGCLTAIVAVVVVLGLLIAAFLMLPNDDSTLGSIKGKVQGALSGAVENVSNLLHHDASVQAELQEFSAAPTQGTAPMDVVFTLTTNKTAAGVRVVDADGNALTATATPYSDNAESRIWMLTLSMDAAWSGTVEAQVQGADGTWIASGRTQTLTVNEPPMTTIAADVFATEEPTAQPVTVPTQVPASTDVPEENPMLNDGEPIPEEGQPDTQGMDDGEPIPEEGLTDLQPEATATLEPTAQPTATLAPTEAPTDTPVPTDTPTPVPLTGTPAPTDTPTPAPTDTPRPRLEAEADPAADPEKLSLKETVYDNSKKLTSYTRDAQSVFDLGDERNYTPQDFGVVTFRGSNFRQNAASGTVASLPESLSVAWTVDAGSVAAKSRTYHGIGWTGQPAIIKWSMQVRAMTNIVEEKRDTKALKEVILAGLDGKIYFLDLADGQPTRDAINVGYPMKGSVSLSSNGMPLMAVGQYARQMKNGNGDIGVRFFNLFNQKQLYLLDGLDGKLKRPISADGAFDTSPLFNWSNRQLGMTAIGSNGMLYTMDLNTEFDVKQGSISISPKTIAMSTKASGQTSKNVKVLSSQAMYQQYVYYADMTGVLHCVDTTTMTTVWAVKTGDAVQAAVALDFDDDGTLWVYTANTLKNRKKGTCDIRRYNAMTGAEGWTLSVPVKTGKDDTIPGAMASPVLGANSIDDLAIFTLSKVNDEEGLGVSEGLVVAVKKDTGAVAWTAELDAATYSSPVAVYTADGDARVIQCTSDGTIYLLDAETGRTISSLKVEGEIEGSPAVYRDMMVVGTTGKGTSHIYGIQLN